jgi:hypothetical protein
MLSGKHGTGHGAPATVVKVKEIEKAKGARGSGSNQYREVRSNNTTAPSVKTLADYGLSYDQSSRFQKLADIPGGFFLALIYNANFFISYSNMRADTGICGGSAGVTPFVFCGFRLSGLMPAFSIG